MAHALVLQWGSQQSQAPPPRSAWSDSCQHLHSLHLQVVLLAGWSAQILGLLCSHSAPALPKSLGITVDQKEGRKENQACASSANQTKDWIPQRNNPLFPFKGKQLTYISCTTDIVHSNDLTVLCIYESMHVFVPLPHKQLAHFFSGQEEVM